MKRIICLITVLCLVFGSFSFCFAVDWSTTDQQNLSNAASRLNTIINLLSSGGSLYSLINTISNNVNTIKGYLVDSGHGVAYWVNAISTWMSPIYNSIQAIPVDLSTITGALGYTQNGTYYPYLLSLAKANTNYKTTFWDSSDWSTLAHSDLANNSSNDVYVRSYYSLPHVNADGAQGQVSTQWWKGTPIGNLAYILKEIDTNIVLSYRYRWAADLTGYNSQQSLVSFADPDSTVTFTPLSATDGIYKYLNAINTPLARLGYVLASDSRIEAQEAAAANEQAVVDNFIESTGAGSTSPSDIGSISDLSSGYQNNFGSSASVTGIFDIFDSNNFGWFSQETVNQLDTSSNNSRAKSGSEFETPLLDQRINDIYDALGVKP